MTDRERIGWMEEWVQEGNRIEINQEPNRKIRFRLRYDGPRPIDFEKDSFIDALDAAIEATL
jgi:hypothetical protein